MTWRPVALITLGILIVAATACAQTVRTGGLDNLAVGATPAASSSASPYDGKYGPPQAIDENGGTRWASSADASMPQWFELSFPEPVTVTTVVIEQSDMKTIYANAERIELTFSAGDPVEATLEDSWAPQVVHFEPRETTSLRVTILSVYEPKVYVGIDELQVFNDPNRVVQPVIPPRQRWDDPDLTAHGRDTHPCVNKTPEDVERALRNIERYDFLADYVANMKEQADEWLERSDEWILEMIPEPGAAFAYGFTGCPICGAKWGTWGGARCSWDNPGHVTCSNGHVLPDAEHPDPGTGYIGEDGRIHYFVGSWNAWVVETLQFDALRPLCLTYLLTGDERYAQKAAVIMDGIAQIYPECDAGSWDYPSDPPSGRLCRPWYQVARVLIHYVDFYDEIFNSPALDEPSLVEGMTRRENIEQNLLRNGAWYCYEQSLKGGLHNGEADYIRGALAVGCVLGIDHYVDWALDGPYGIRSMIANNADRDGRYYETSLSYALLARALYLTFAEPMRNYRSEAYPNGIDLYADDKFLSFYFLPEALFDCAGHWPRYGDSGPDVRSTWPSDPIFSDTDYRFAEVCYRRTTGEHRELFASALNYLAGERGEEIRASARNDMWMLFHAADFPDEADTAPIRERLTSSDFFGQKGIGILRAGDGSNAQAALLRYGESLNHGHYDDLNLNYYALGYELTYDLGYGLGSTHSQVGWGKQTASHNLVVVDETPQHRPGSGSGGSLLLFDEMPGLHVMEAEASAAYAAQGVDRYRRLIAMIGDGANRYLVDLFRVRGGSQHDYMLHALSDEVEVTGVELGEPEEGSLAGPDIRWGALQGNDGDIKGHPNKPYWNPPPGNGYGFLMNPRRGAAGSTWTAEWEIEPSRQARLRAIGLPEPGTELITAWAPGIYPHLPKAAYVCARRTGQDLQSAYLTILEPYDRTANWHAILAPEIAAMAEVSDGEVKYVDAVDVALFQAQAAGDRMTFPLEVPATGEYVVSVGHYLSPSYGTARLLIDGQPVGEPFRGTAPDVAPADPVEFPPMTLEAGEHEVAVELVEADAEGNYWMGISLIGLQPAARADETTEARPQIVSARRLTGDREGAVGVHVVGRDGVEDWLFTAVDPEPTTWSDGFASAARLAYVRTDADGPARVSIIGGTELQMPGMTLRPAHDALRATVIEVDEAQREVVLEVEGPPLPEGDSLRNATVQFSNPRYSRNSAYHIASITRDGDRYRLGVREATFLLGKAVMDGPPQDKENLLSLVPHDYARPMPRTAIPEEADFFAGKLLRAEEGTQTTCRQVVYGQPQRIRVDDSLGFDDGDVAYYHDVRAGDTVTIIARVALTRTGDGIFAIDANVPLTIEGVGAVSYRMGDTWRTAENGVVPAEATEVRLEDA